MAAPLNNTSGSTTPFSFQNNPPCGKRLMCKTYTKVSDLCQKAIAPRKRISENSSQKSGGKNFHKAQKEKYCKRADLMTYSLQIAQAASTGDLDTVYNLFKDMKSDNFPLTAYIIESLIDLYVNRKEYMYAEEIMRQYDVRALHDDNVLDLREMTLGTAYMLLRGMLEQKKTVSEFILIVPSDNPNSLFPKPSDYLMEKISLHHSEYVLLTHTMQGVLLLLKKDQGDNFITSLRGLENKASELRPYDLGDKKNIQIYDTGIWPEKPCNLNYILQINITKNDEKGVQKCLTEAKSLGLKFTRQAYKYLILFYAEKNFEAACDFIHDKNFRGFNLSAFEYNKLLWHADQDKHAEKLYSWINEMKAHQVTPDRHTYQTLAFLFLCKDDIKRTEELLVQCKNDNIKQPTTLYTFILRYYTDHLEETKARNLFEEMIQLNIKPNEYTFENMIDLFINKGYPDPLNELFKLINNRKIDKLNTIIQTLITIYQNKQNSKIVDAIIHKFNVNITSIPSDYECTSADKNELSTLEEEQQDDTSIHVNTDLKSPTEKKELFYFPPPTWIPPPPKKLEYTSTIMNEQGPKIDIHPNFPIQIPTIRGDLFYISPLSWTFPHPQNLGYNPYVMNGQIPDSNTIQSLLKMCIGNKDVVTANQVIEIINSGKVYIGMDTFNLMIKLYLSVEAIDSAYYILNHLNEKNLNPNIYIYNTFLAYFRKKIDLIQAYHIIDKMKANGVEPDVLSHQFLIDIHVEMKQFDKANDCIKKRGIEPQIQGRVLDLHILSHGTVYMMVRNWLEIHKEVKELHIITGIGWNSVNNELFAMKKYILDKIEEFHSEYYVEDTAFTGSLILRYGTNPDLCQQLS